MGKQGPCYHCGVSSTPLWRNGPPEKPVLCNACGSRWRTKGTLENYTPLHSRTETDEPEGGCKVSRVKTVSLKNKEIQFSKRKLNDDLIVGSITPEYNMVSQKSQDDDIRNRSSSGSAISNAESCGQFGYEDASDLTDPVQPIAWEKMVSKKRTCFTRPKVSSVEKLTRDLYTIYKEQQQSSEFSMSYQDDLIFENDKPMVSVEIGHGSMLIQCPTSIAREEESETSSLSFDNKLINEAYSPSPAFTMYSHKVAPNWEFEKLKRDIRTMGNYNPQLLYVDLSGVFNLYVFTHFLSHDEQQQLLKHLPSLDTANLPHSLENMFASIQFKENISSFQKFLAEGVLDSSLSGAPVEEFNMSKRKRLEQDDSILKDVGRTGENEKENGKGELTMGNSTNTNTKRTWSKSFSGWTTSSCKSPDRKITKGNDKSCYRHSVPQNVLPFPSDGAYVMHSSSLQSVDKPYNEDLLFEVPSNGSFPEAELLIKPTSTFGSKTSTINSSKVSFGFV